MNKEGVFWVAALIALFLIAVFSAIGIIRSHTDSNSPYTAQGACKKRDNPFWEVSTVAYMPKGKLGPVSHHNYTDLNGFVQTIDERNSDQWICILKDYDAH